ncbi:MAG: helicase [Bacteroidaceae bacterium]|nr:helicase [Bacteroidaceae bacterium]
MKKNDEKDQFLRIGTKIYKNSQRPDVHGEVRDVRIEWSVEAIRQDFGNDEARHIIDSMPKYDGEIPVPGHIDYKPIIGNWINSYKPLKYQPQKGVDFPHIRGLVKHIFGEQYELGMDYLQLLYLQPIQKLPVILLVSRKTDTGKSTFVHFLHEIYGDNAIHLTNNNLRSQFNSDWTRSLLIMIEETLMNRREDSEMLKNMVTAYNYQSEAKGKDRVGVQFFAKLIMCSNNEENPVIIEPEDTRFWVRKIETPKERDPRLMEKLTYEIPAFLHFLTKRNLSTQMEDRLWFRRDLIETDAWRSIVNGNRHNLEKQTLELCEDIMDSCQVGALYFCLNDLMNLLSYAGYKVERLQVKQMLQKKWQLSPSVVPNTYNTYLPDATVPERYSAEHRQGRYYTITQEFLHKLTV